MTHWQRWASYIIVIALGATITALAFVVHTGLAIGLLVLAIISAFLCSDGENW